MRSTAKVRRECGKLRHYFSNIGLSDRLDLCKLSDNTLFGGHPKTGDSNTMKLVTIDWLIIAAYFVLSLMIGLYYARRAGRSTEEYFLSDRSMPWWLAGTSMVATTFAADTPLAVTEMVARNGVAGNWLWWSMLLSGMLTVFFFARLDRKSTRLNSSHSQISYAVFCLKKKKK